MAQPSSSVHPFFDIKPQKEYLGGFVATGIVAVVQTITPLLVYQLWKKNDLINDTSNKWFQYAWQAMQAGGVINYGLTAVLFLASFMIDLQI